MVLELCSNSRRLVELRIKKKYLFIGSMNNLIEDNFKNKYDNINMKE